MFTIEMALGRLKYTILHLGARLGPFSFADVQGVAERSTSYAKLILLERVLEIPARST
jgi:hypothetical protein